jgi:hypothetical protein
VEVNDDCANKFYAVGDDEYGLYVFAHNRKSNDYEVL